MTHRDESNVLAQAVELLAQNAFDGIAESVPPTF